MTTPIRAETQLERTLGLSAALMIGIGTMIGAGIFVLPGPAAGAAGPAVALSFLIGGVIALLTALSASELATAMPQAGGSYHFINRGLGPAFGSIAGLGNWIGLAFASAFYVVGFGSYLGLLLEAVIAVPTIAIGPVVLTEAQLGGLVAAAFFVAVNFVSTKGTGDLQNLIVIGLLGILGVFVVLGLTGASVATLRPFAPHGWGAVLPGTALVFVSYLGFVKITTVAGEIKHPARNLPIAIVGSVVVVTLLYGAVILVILGIVDPTAIAGSETAVADVAGTVFGDLFGVAVIGVGLLTFAGLLATASSANASILAASRISYAMGRDGTMFPWLNEINDRFKTPGRAIMVTGGLILVLVLVGDVGTLARSAAVLHLVVYGLLNVALIVFRETDAIVYEPAFRVPLYPWVPILGALSSFGLIAFMDPIEVALAIGLIVIGVGWFIGYARRRTDDDSALARYRSPATVEPQIELTGDRGIGEDRT